LPDSKEEQKAFWDVGHLPHVSLPEVSLCHLQGSSPYGSAPNPVVRAGDHLLMEKDQIWCFYHGEYLILLRPFVALFKRFMFFEFFFVENLCSLSWEIVILLDKENGYFVV
jgi:hypothetical protein